MDWMSGGSGNSGVVDVGIGDVGVGWGEVGGGGGEVGGGRGGVECVGFLFGRRVS